MECRTTVVCCCALLFAVARMCNCKMCSSGWWVPHPYTSWQWQIDGESIDTSFDVAMYDVDMWETPQSTINDLQDAGIAVICYFSAGSWEDWRDDADDFPDCTIGKELDGWAGEKWLDIRQQSVRDIMASRMDFAVSKNCDGIEPDNVNNYAEDTGFDISDEDQLNYNRFLATEAHKRALSIALKNDPDQVEDLVDYFDYALNEECPEWDECPNYNPFIDADKAVTGAIYDDQSDYPGDCSVPNSLNFDFLYKVYGLSLTELLTFNSNSLPIFFSIGIWIHGLNSAAPTRPALPTHIIVKLITLPSLSLTQHTHVPHHL
ncbi:endo alpha-1,4 polygalactosaminidase [Pelomyxa schiedti]|nr:endo alpha-1,4 polygalactosaminidase [Pelomyxa schiedti]